MDDSTNQWEIRYSWQPDAGITHPENSFERRTSSRDALETYACTRWERSEHGLTMTAVEIRQLPDGQWERLLPYEPSCDVRSGGYADEEVTEAR